MAINWKAAGRGPRLADFAWLMWGTFGNPTWVDAAVGAYRQHVELTDDELDRLGGMMYVRPLYLMCFVHHRSLTSSGQRPEDGAGWWSHISATAAATRAAYRQ